MSLKLSRYQLLISGRVQGVGFRYATQKEAARLGLVGWVRNTTQGRVEITAEGPLAQLAILETWCHKGPSPSRVSSVNLVANEPIEKVSYPSFSIEPTHDEE